MPEPLASVRLDHEDVGEVREVDAVRYGASKTHLLSGVAAVDADNAPRSGDLGVDVDTSALSAPVGLCRQPAPDHVELDADRVIVEFVLHSIIVIPVPPTSTGRGLINR